MGHHKIAIELLKKPKKRHVAFAKRRPTLFNKANELTILCGVEIAIVVFSPGNKPYSFGHPTVDVVATKFLQQEGGPNYAQDNSFSEVSNIDNLNLQLTGGSTKVHPSEKKGEEHDEVLKQHDTTQLSELKELKDSYIELKGKVKSRLYDLEMSECKILSAKEALVEMKKEEGKK